MLAKAFSVGRSAELAVDLEAHLLQTFELSLVNVALPGELVDLDIDVDVLQLCEQLTLVTWWPGRTSFSRMPSTFTYTDCCVPGLHFERAVHVRRQRHEPMP